MSRSFALLAATFVACAACSSSPGNSDTTAGTGGAGGSSSHAATGTGGASSATASSGTGGDAGACSDPTNPMFGSCIVPFLAGCWAPDLSGTCTDSSGVTAWSDGSKYVTQGSMPGIYAPGAATPCIAMVFGQGSITGTKGSQTIHFLADAASQSATITCPDGTSFTATDDQVTAFNRCEGLNCP